MSELRRLATTALVALSLATLALPAAHAITIDMVTVGDPGNVADDTGYGAVADAFRIAKYEVTIQQYTDFLNAAAATDPYGLYYEAGMLYDYRSAGIVRSGDSGSYTYSVVGPYGVNPPGASSAGNRPITYVSWWDAARFANWMHNGQLTGTAGAASTETGAYTLGGATSGTAPGRNPDANFYLPTEDQWYKAAYYKGGGPNAGYWDYPTQSDTAPGNAIGSGTNQANYFANGVHTVNGQPLWTFNQNWLTDVGAFTNSPGPYQTFDMGGNVWEWHDGTGNAGLKGYLGGSIVDGATEMVSTASHFLDDGSGSGAKFGFRLIAPVPEPATWVMGLGGLACVAWRARRRHHGRVLGRATAVGAVMVAAALALGNEARAVSFELVTVGDPGNEADSTGYGAVAYTFQISKYETTVDQYVAFLNANAKTDTYSLFDGRMSGSISRLGSDGNYVYAAQAFMGTKPITYVNWYKAARFANWMNNDQVAGSTETGAYTLNGQQPASGVTRNQGAVVWLPSEDEWYKAAYFNRDAGAYWAYPTQSNDTPAKVSADVAGVGSAGQIGNYANYGRGANVVTVIGTNRPWPKWFFVSATA